MLQVTMHMLWLFISGAVRCFIAFVSFRFVLLLRWFLVVGLPTLHHHFSYGRTVFLWSLVESYQSLVAGFLVPLRCDECEQFRVAVEGGMGVRMMVQWSDGCIDR